MATINEVIRRVGRTRPNTLEDEDKARWLLELEGRIYREVTGADEPEARPVENWPEQGDEPLLVKAPYDSLYDLWLGAQAEFAVGNYEDYDALAGQFEETYAAFRALWRREHRPGAGGQIVV